MPGGRLEAAFSHAQSLERGRVIAQMENRNNFNCDLLSD
jgi:hypothetical protein